MYGTARKVGEHEREFKDRLTAWKDSIYKQSKLHTMLMPVNKKFFESLVFPGDDQETIERKRILKEEYDSEEKTNPTKGIDMVGLLDRTFADAFHLEVNHWVDLIESVPEEEQDIFFPADKLTYADKRRIAALLQTYRTPEEIAENLLTIKYRRANRNRNKG